MNETTNSGPALDLLARTLDLIKQTHGARMADAPETRDLIAEMIAVGIHEEAALVEFVGLAGGKRYDRSTATFH